MISDGVFDGEGGTEASTNEETQAVSDVRKVEVEPWALVGRSSSTIAGVAKVARLLKGKAEDGTYMFGESGYNLGCEAEAWCQFKHGLATKRTERKRKKKCANSPEESAHYESCKGLIKYMKDRYLANLKTEYPQVNYGLDIKLLQGLIHQGRTEEDIRERIDEFVQCGLTQTEFTSSRIFVAGRIKDMCTNIGMLDARLATKRKAVEASKVRRIPASVLKDEAERKAKAQALAAAQAMTMEEAI